MAFFRERHVFLIVAFVQISSIVGYDSWHTSHLRLSPDTLYRLIFHLIYPLMFYHVGNRRGQRQRHGRRARVSDGHRERPRRRLRHHSGILVTQRADRAGRGGRLRGRIHLRQRFERAEHQQERGQEYQAGDRQRLLRGACCVRMRRSESGRLGDRHGCYRRLIGPVERWRVVEWRVVERRVVERRVGGQHAAAERRPLRLGFRTKRQVIAAEQFLIFLHSFMSFVVFCASKLPNFTV